MNESRSQAIDRIRPLTDAEILAGLQRNISALQNRSDATETLVNALQIRVRELERAAAGSVKP